jgi:NhaP-type Na+/H+ or K+/H+ antiporter
MRSLFGALFGLVIGILVSALLKNNQLFEVLKEVFKNPSYLSLIIAFAILGWVIGMSQWKKTQTISSTKEGDKKEGSQYNSIEWEAATLLILVILGFLVSLSICKCLAFGFIFINEIIWVWLLIKYERLKPFRKSPPAGSEDKNKQNPG